MNDNTSQNLDTLRGFATPNQHGVDRIVSGGQTGADRGGLDAAIALGINHGGYCPLGRKAEDGIIPEQYVLRECSTDNYGQRTAKNIEHSHGTLIVSFRAEADLDGGTLHTMKLAKKRHKGLLHVQLPPTGALAVSTKSINAIRAWLYRVPVRILNVAGPRESKEPGLQEATRDLLMLLLGQESS